MVVAVAFALTRTGWFARFEVADAQTSHGLLLWDGTWYQDLVSFGYDGTDETSQRFFPLYHLIGRAVNVVLGHPAVALVVVSNAAALIALWAMYRLVQRLGFSDAVACRSVWWLALLPAAATTTFGYSESLSISLGIVAVWALLDRRWWLGVLAGFGVGLTRSVGALICAVLVVAALEALVARWRSRQTQDSFGDFVRAEWRAIVGSVAVIAAPALGFVTYMVWLRSHFGSWDVPLEAQRQFRMGWRDPFTRFFDGLVDVVGGDGTDMFNISFAVLAVVVLAVAVRRVPLWASTFVGLTLAMALAANNINSLGRYVVAAFPLALMVAITEERIIESVGVTGRVRTVLTVGASVLSGGLMVVYCLWAWSGRMIP